jgi:hypothetical protein
MKSRLVALGALILLAGCGSKVPPGPPQWNPFSALPPRDENYHGGVAGLLNYDTNKDGILTREELLAGLRAEFAIADKANGGCLSDSEVATINQARIAADQSAATPLQDWNQDGCVNFQEFATAPVSLFDETDRDHDGRLTPQEFDRAEGRGAGGGQGRDQRGGRGGRGERP